MRHMTFAKIALSLSLVVGMMPQLAFAENAEAPEAQPEEQALEAEETPEEQALEAEAQPEEEPEAQAAEAGVVLESYSWYMDNPDADTFYISSYADLYGLAALVNGTVSGMSAVSFKGKTIIQSNGISLYLFDPETYEFEPHEFTPIGTEAHPFEGTYDGQGNSISGLTIESARSDCGLFGYAGESSSIRNIWIEDNDDRPSMIRLKTDKVIKNIGSIVGRTLGRVQNCRSAASVEVISTASISAAAPSALSNVGGVVGYSCADVSECYYSGLLSCEIGASALSSDSSSDALQVADSFGGIVGHFGEPTKYGTLSNCKNDGNVWVRATGSGSVDNFGQTTFARSAYVGGICGYSNGSIIDCNNGTHDSYAKTGMVSTSAEDKYDGAAKSNIGGSEVGGIVGGVRSTTSDPNKYNDGDPAHPVKVQNCRNYGGVTGCVSVGGIAGETGAYVTITQCANGNPSDSAETQRHVVSTRWNKPMTGGIVGRTRGGTISYCANYWPVSNIQLGYFVAGICGALWVADDYPNLVAELYSCINTGQIRTSNEDVSSEYREAGILGTNEGYLHDCVMLDGTVPFHSDQIVGNANQGNVSNCAVMSFEEMRSPACAALLNTQAANDSNWETYWFINGEGYPVVNTWVEPADIKWVNLAEQFASAELVSNAKYAGEGGLPVPSVSVKLKDGTQLVQGTDFYVVAQAGASAITSEGQAPYKASIKGLGRFTGEVLDCVSYGIDKGSLAEANISPASGTYAFGRAVFPSQVKVSFGSTELEKSDYSYVIYDDSTNLTDGVLPSNPFKAFDSLGYVQIGSGQLTPVSKAGDLNEIKDYFVLYDRNKEKISDSNGAIYYASATNRGGVPGTVNSTRKSCTELKRGTPAGYLVQVIPTEGSETFEGEGFGYYVIDALNMARYCQVDSVTCQGQTWYWDADSASLYKKDASGNKVPGTPSATFTGASIEPDAALSFGSYKLVKDKDFSIVYGDPDPSTVIEGALPDSSQGSTGADEDINRNVTSATTRAALTLRPVDTNQLSSYIMAYFNIAPAKLENCVAKVSASSFSYTGSAIKPVTLTLNGNLLVEGKDYNITYKDNVNAGKATYTITPLANLSGGVGSITGTFTISKNDISSAAVALSATSATYTGAPFAPAVASAKAGATALRQGADFTVSYLSASKAQISAPSAAGTYYVRLTGAGTYTGTVDVPFSIAPAPITSVTLSATSFKWTGKALSPKATVYATVAGAKRAIAAKAGAGTADFSLSLPAAKNVGAYTVTVTGKGNYTGSAKAKFTVVPKGTTLSKLTAAKRGFTVKWKAQKSQTSGYQVRYSLKSSMASSKSFKVTKTSTVSKKKTGLKAKKKYYVQVRTLKKVGGTTYYSAWSAKKSVKTK